MKIILFALFSIAQAILLFKLKSIKKVRTYMLFSVLTLFFCGTSIVALILWVVYFKKTRDSIFEKVSLSPSDITSDELIEYIKVYGLENDPQQWNRLRGVWFAINESPNVSTQKKKQLRDFLTVQGLRLVGSEINIIDNYGK